MKFMKSLGPIEHYEVDNIIKNDMNELEILKSGKAHKARMVLCGSILEGIILYECLVDKEGAKRALIEVKKEEAKKQQEINSKGKTKEKKEEKKIKISGKEKEILNWDLAKLAKVFVKMKLEEEKISANLINNLKEFRNLIHPGKIVRDNITISEGKAMMCEGIVKDLYATYKVRKLKRNLAKKI